MMVTMDEEYEEPEPLLGSLQEGYEWIARLEKEQSLLEMDLLAANESISEMGIGAIAFSLEKTKEAIEQIKLEMMMLNG